MDILLEDVDITKASKMIFNWIFIITVNKLHEASYKQLMFMDFIKIT